VKEDDIYNAMIHVISRAIGPQLHQVKSTGTTTRPAIFKKAVANTKEAPILGLLPYCQISMGVKSNAGARHHSRYYNADGDRVTQIIKTVQCAVNIVGGAASDMCSDLQNYILSSDYATTYLSELGIGVYDSGGVVPQTTVLSNKPHDSAFVLFNLNVIDTVVEEFYEMTTIEAELELNNTDSDQTITQTNISIP
jgi:hypothetical protein